jgi:hypothetical protein
MPKMSLFKFPVLCFVLSFVVAASTSAYATARWTRVAFGTGVGQYGGGNMGCTVGNGSVTNSDSAFCPIIDNDTITSYTGASAWFSNSNPTQPMYACVSFTNKTGDACSSTSASCPNRGVCQDQPLNIAAWQQNMGQFKYVEFDDLTVGAQLSGYVLYYNSSI